MNQTNRHKQITTSTTPPFSTNVAKGLQDVSFIITGSRRVFLFITSLFLFCRTFFISTFLFSLFFSRSSFITFFSFWFLSFHILSLILGTFFILLLHNLLDKLIN